MEFLLRDISCIDDIHKVFDKGLGFPSFYGRNPMALIDCLSGLWFEDSGMTEFYLENDENFEITVIKKSVDQKLCRFLEHIAHDVNSKLEFKNIKGRIIINEIDELKK